MVKASMEQLCPFLSRAVSFTEHYGPGTELTPDSLQEFGSMGIREGVNPRSVRCESCINRLVMRTEVAPDSDAWPLIGTISSLALRSSECLRRPIADPFAEETEATT